MHISDIKSVLGIMIISLLFSVGSVFITNDNTFAKTADGKTPAEETICDPLSGTLFGLCNAYCEAMDCDSEDTRASDRACERVLGNFQKKAQAVGPPCVCSDICLDIAQECTENCTADGIACFRRCIDAGNDPSVCRERCGAIRDECNLECRGGFNECNGDCCEQAGEVFVPGVGCVEPICDDDDRDLCGGQEKQCLTDDNTCEVICTGLFIGDTPQGPLCANFQCEPCDD